MQKTPVFFESRPPVGDVDEMIFGSEGPVVSDRSEGEPRGSPFLFTVAKKSSIIIGRFYKESSCQT